MSPTSCAASDGIQKIKSWVKVAVLGLLRSYTARSVEPNRLESVDRRRRQPVVEGFAKIWEQPSWCGWRSSLRSFPLVGWFATSKEETPCATAHQPMMTEGWTDFKSSNESNSGMFNCKVQALRIPTDRQIPRKSSNSNSNQVASTPRRPGRVRSGLTRLCCFLSSISPLKFGTRSRTLKDRSFGFLAGRRVEIGLTPHVPP
jgi:hypothetical protein